MNAVLRGMSQRVEAIVMHRILRYMAIRHEARLREVLVRGEALERVGQHRDDRLRVDYLLRRGHVGVLQFKQRLEMGEERKLSRKCMH